MSNYDDERTQYIWELYKVVFGIVLTGAAVMISLFIFSEIKEADIKAKSDREKDKAFDKWMFYNSKFNIYQDKFMGAINKQDLVNAKNYLYILHKYNDSVQKFNADTQLFDKF